MTLQLRSIYHLHPSVSTDTRKVRPGDLFFALKGDRFDGNQFAGKALAAGAAYAVVDDPAVCLPEDDRYVLVENSLKALQDLANAYRREFAIPFVALTGSNGKTTTKELIYSVLNAGRRAYATAGNFNNHIGVPLTLLDMPRDAEIAIIEMGANQPGDIAELTAIAEPTHGLITNIGAAHLERFRSLEGVRRTKGELFDFLRMHDGMVFLNEADPAVVSVAGGINNRLTYGSAYSDFQYRLLENEPGRMQIKISHTAWRQPEIFTSQLSGEYNAMNILAAVAVGSYFGISLEGLKKGIASYIPANNRSQLLKKGGRTLWLDAYNANPTSMQAAIRNMFSMQSGKVALILGDMFELGEQSEALHTELGRIVNGYAPAMTIGVGPMMKHAIAAVHSPKAWFETVEELEPQLLQLLQGIDLILIKGSRGMTLERLTEFL